MTENLKELERVAFDEVWNKGNLAFIDEVTALDAVSHDPNVQGGLIHGTEGFKQLVATYRSAFPDVHFEINEMVQEGNKVAVRWTATGTHKGVFMGIPPTGKRLTVAGISLDSFRKGKVVESWTSYDALGMFQQLGLAPSAAI